MAWLFGCYMKNEHGGGPIYYRRAHALLSQLQHFISSEHYTNGIAI